MNIIGEIPIYWINLDRSEDRKKFMEKQFKQYNIKNNVRIEAIDGNTLNENVNYPYNYHHSSGLIKLTKCEIACTMSHIKAIKQAYLDDIDFALIMEDDCDFRYLNFQKKSIIELFEIAKDAEVIQLLTTCPYYELCVTDELLLKGFKWNAGAYVITKKGINNLLNIDGSTIKLTEADDYVYRHLITYHVTKPYFRIGTKYDTLIHYEGNLDYHNHLVNINTKFWDEYYMKK
jgi:hypothetical protein